MLREVRLRICIFKKNCSFGVNSRNKMRKKQNRKKNQKHYLVMVWDVRFWIKISAKETFILNLKMQVVMTVRFQGLEK